MFGSTVPVAGRDYGTEYSDTELDCMLLAPSARVVRVESMMRSEVNPAGGAVRHTHTHTQKMKECCIKSFDSNSKSKM